MNILLVDFYLHGGQTDHRHTLKDIMGYDDYNLERGHNYIQWLLPTATASQRQPKSPILTWPTALALTNSPNFAPRYWAAVKKMLAFWEIPFKESGECSLVPQKIERVPFWAITPNDHNQLRISRVLESTRLLGGKSSGSEFSKRLMDELARFATRNDHRLSARNVAYWYKAVVGIEF